MNPALGLPESQQIEAQVLPAMRRFLVHELTPCW
jgi:hypothetical protein